MAAGVPLENAKVATACGAVEGRAKWQWGRWGGKEEGGWRGGGAAGAIATSGPCYATLKSSASSPYGRATAIKANSYVSLMHTHTHTRRSSGWYKTNFMCVCFTTRTHTRAHSEVAAGGVKSLPVQRNLIREQLNEADRQTERRTDGRLPPTYDALHHRPVCLSVCLVTALTSLCETLSMFHTNIHNRM